MDRLRHLIELRQELTNEERSLKEARKIIQKQINALDIEKLHLESVAKKPGTQPTNSTDIDTREPNDDEPKELDLDVPSHMTISEEEDDEDL